MQLSVVSKKNGLLHNIFMPIGIYLYHCMIRKAISEFPPGLCFKTKVGAQPLMRKSFFILMQIKLIFTRLRLCT